MNALFDEILVGIVLLISAGYAITSLGPRTLRKRLLAALSRLMAAAPAYLGLGRAALKLSAASQNKATGACGGCDNCGTEPPAPQSANAEINVPVANIGRRASEI